jgi:hypothetical protein
VCECVWSVSVCVCMYVTPNNDPYPPLSDLSYIKFSNKLTVFLFRIDYFFFYRLDDHFNLSSFLLFLQF